MSWRRPASGFSIASCREDDTASKVRGWLEDLRKQSGLISLEIVVEERSADAGTFLSVPWNLVYDERPAKYKAAFQKGQGVERWRPFWSVRYNLTSGRRVEPLKRLPLWSDPRVIVGDGSDRPRRPQRGSEATAGSVPGRGGPDGSRLDGRTGGGARGGLPPAALLAGTRNTRVPAS